MEKWFDECCKHGLVDIKFLTPIKAKERNLLGFANSRPNFLVCFYKNGKVTYFTAHHTNPVVMASRCAFNLNAIIAVGSRVNSKRATAFRQ